MEQIIAEVRRAHPIVDLRLHPRLVAARAGRHWQVDISWRLTHTAFVAQQAASSDNIRAFLERVIARELELTSQEGRAELRRFRGEQLGPPEARQTTQSAATLWEMLDQVLVDDDS